MPDVAPTARIRRIVETSNGLLLLDISNFVGGLQVAVSVFDRDGWEERSKRKSTIDFLRSHNSPAPERRQDARTAAIEEAAAIPHGEAEQIAEQTLAEWIDRVDADDLEDAGAMRFAFGFMLVLVLIVGAAIIGLIAVAIVFVF